MDWRQSLRIFTHGQGQDNHLEKDDIVSDDVVDPTVMASGAEAGE